MKILEVAQLSKTYGIDETEVAALKNVTFSVDRGEFISIVGPSGSGKSTLLHLIGGLETPSSGKVIVNGQDINGYDEDKLAAFRRKQVGFIFQSYNLVPVLDVEENIALPALLENGKVDKQYLDEIIAFLGLQQRKGHLPAQLSGGQQQRVAIGRALINRPAIILADEPTGNLDSHNSQQVMQLLRSMIRRYQQTLILITHDPKVAAMSDRVVEMLDGEIAVDKMTNA